MTQTLWIQTRRKGTAGKALGHGWTDGRGSLSRICWIFVGSSEAVVSLLASILCPEGDDVWCLTQKQFGNTEF